MSYVRSMWVVVPITLIMAGVAAFFAWTAVFTGRYASFLAVLPKTFVVVAVLGFFASVGGANVSAARLSAAVPSRSLHERKPGEVSLSTGAAFFISSALVAVIAFLIS